MKIEIRRTWLIAALGLLLICAAAAAGAIVLTGGSGATSSDELVRTLAEGGDAQEQREAARELASRLEPASVTELNRLVPTNSAARPGLGLLREELIALFDAPETTVEQRRKVLDCLGEDRGDAAAEFLVRKLSSDPDSSLQQAAASALAKNRSLSPAIVELLVTARQDATGATGAGNPGRVELLDNAVVQISEPAVRALLNVIRYESEPAGSWATGLIGRIGLPALPLLRDRLRRGDVFEEQVAACFGLLELRKHHPKQIAPLIETIVSKMISRVGIPVPGEHELQVLAAIGKLAVDRIVAVARKPYSSVSGAQKKLWENSAHMLATIAHMNPAATAHLVSALERKDYELIADLALFFVMLGKSGSEKAMIDALDAAGDSVMAIQFLNSGNVKLAEGARAWATSKGFAVTSLPGAAPPSTWGTGGG